jgi:streptogramin lyase
MKYLRTALLLLICAASVAGVVQAANMSASKIQPWLGTWSCTSPGNNHTATFTAVFGGNAMTIAETGKPASQETVWFDTKRGKWIDEYADASGEYNVEEGTPSGNSIHFVQVYPASSGPTLLVTMKSSTTYTSLFSATMNGKHIAIRETCTKT